MATTSICVQVYNTDIQIENTLKENGFKVKKSIIQYDSYYTNLTPNEAKNVSYAKLMQHTFLLRSIKEVGSLKHYLIFKDKTINSKNEVIKEEKFETEMASINQAKSIFSTIGVYNWCRYEVIETDFEKRNVVLTIQKIDGLGTFLELNEIPNMIGNSDSKFQQLTYIANSFGLDLGTDYSCKKSYMKFKKSF